jgi:hypothetical protein
MPENPGKDRRMDHNNTMRTGRARNTAFSIAAHLFSIFFTFKKGLEFFN